MAGLEKIIDQIIQEAKDTSNQQLDETRIEANQILEEARIKREAYYTAMMEQVDAEIKQLLERGESAANLQKRKLLLNAKQQIIEQIFEDATDAILKLPDQEYFNLLLHMVDRYSLSQDGTIHMSKQDLDRMPESFQMELHKRNIAIENEPERICGGFILSYGEIEENCTFDALFDQYSEDLLDKVKTILFA